MILWLPDTFGYSAALPQILKSCGVKYLVTQKIFWSYNEGDRFPYHYFTWQGADGSRIDSPQIQQVVLAHGVDVADGVVGIEAEAWSADFHLDVLRHLEGCVEPAVPHLHPAMIQHVLVIVHLRGIGAILHLRLGLLVEELQPQLTVEMDVGFSAWRQDLALQGHHAHGMELHRAVLSIYSVDP